MKKIILIFLLAFSFNAIGQDIYITRVDTADDVTTITRDELTTIDSTFIYELAVQRLYMYMDTSGTFNLQGVGCILSSHHVKVDGATTLNFDDLPMNATIYLMLQQDATGGHTITLPTFTNLDTQPVVSTVANKMDVLIIMKMSGALHLHSYVRYNDTF